MLDFSFWEQTLKKDFNFDLSEGETLEVARVDKNKNRAYLKVKDEVYSLNIAFPFDLKKVLHAFSQLQLLTFFSVLQVP